MRIYPHAVSTIWQSLLFVKQLSSTSPLTMISKITMEVNQHFCDTLSNKKIIISLAFMTGPLYLMNWLHLQTGSVPILIYEAFIGLKSHNSTSGYQNIFSVCQILPHIKPLWDPSTSLSLFWLTRSWPSVARPSHTLVIVGGSQLRPPVIRGLTWDKEQEMGRIQICRDDLTLTGSMHTFYIQGAGT